MHRRRRRYSSLYRLASMLHCRISRMFPSRYLYEYFGYNRPPLCRNTFAGAQKDRRQGVGGDVLHVLENKGIRKKLRYYPCTSVRTTCVGSFASIASFASICSSGKDSESYRSNHPLTEARKARKASKATDAPPILPTQPPTLPMQPPTLPTQPPPYGS